MAVRKSLSETIVVAGERSQLLDRCQRAMEKGGFRKVTANDVTFQVSGKLSKMTTAGSLQVTLTPVAEGTQLEMRATGNVDNVYALFRSPNQKILQLFKDNLRMST